MELRWPSRGTVFADVDGKVLRVVGEAMLERQPDFLIFPEHITHWEDGSLLEEIEKVDVIDRIIEEAANRGWIFEVLGSDDE